MIRNLVGQQSPVVLEADVHVIGAGIAGLLAATRLSRAGLRVVVTESGGEHQGEETHPLNEVVHVRSTYQGAAHGRFRCLGGTSTRWGGAMIPFLASDMAGEGARAWPLSHGELLAYHGEVEALFGLPDGPYDAPDLAVRSGGTGGSFVARLAKWPPFTKRNVARLLEADIRDPAGPEIWLNATATGFVLRPDGRLTSVAAEAPDGARVTVSSQETIIAAGAIESTRLLLLMDRAQGGRLFAGHDVIGRYFHDHLSVRIGTIRATDRRALNRVAGFRFEQGGMRNLRFEPSESRDVRRVVPACFAHIVVASQEGSGFERLRDLYRHVQKRKLPSASTLLGLARTSPWLLRAGWWYRRERRLLYPADAALDVHMVIEQVPRADNRVRLSDTQVDMFGQPIAAIDWAVADEDKHNLTAATRLFTQFWAASKLAEFGTIEARGESEALNDLESGGGIYHPGGSTRMGFGPTDAVVDRDLRTFSVNNVSVLSTSTFPSGGGANPTMMLMMATFRAADDIARRVRGRVGAFAAT